MPPVLLFMLDELAIKFIRQSIYGGIHILGFCVCEQVGAGDMHGRLGFLHHLFDAENNMGRRDLIEVPLQSFQFAFYIGFQ